MSSECPKPSDDVTGESVQYETEPGESVSMAVIRAVASVSGRSETPGEGIEDALEPLSESISPDALDAIVESASGSGADATYIEFQYCGHQVAVDGSGRVTVAA